MVAIVSKPTNGYTLKVKEGGRTWLELIGTGTKWDGHTLAVFGEHTPVLDQLKTSVKKINAVRHQTFLLSIQVRYEDQKYW